MKNLKAVQRSIRYFESKIITDPKYLNLESRIEKLKKSKKSIGSKVFKEELQKLKNLQIEVKELNLKVKELKTDRKELVKQSPGYLKKKQKAKDLSNKNRSLTQKNNHLLKKISSVSEKKAEKMLSQIERNERLKSKNQEKIFKYSQKSINLNQSKSDLERERNLIIKVLETGSENYSKEQMASVLARLTDIEGSINAINDVQLMNPVDITVDGIVLQDKKFEDKFHDDDIFLDVIAFWQVQETVKKKIDKEIDRLETVEVRLPLGRVFNFPVTDELTFELSMTELFNEIDSVRTIKGRKTSTPEVNVEYNYTEKIVIVNV